MNKMKRIGIVLLVLPLLFAFRQESNTLVGEWSATNNSMWFDNEGYAALKLGDRTIGGKEFVSNGKKGKMTYELQEKEDVLWVDLIVTELESGNQFKILAIARFITPNEIQIAMDWDNPNIRPLIFEKNISA